MTAAGQDRDCIDGAGTFTRVLVQAGQEQQSMVVKDLAFARDLRRRPFYGFVNVYPLCIAERPSAQDTMSCRRRRRNGLGRPSGKRLSDGCPQLRRVSKTCFSQFWRCFSFEFYLRVFF